MLNLFQHHKQRFCLVLKHVQGNERMGILNQVPAIPDTAYSAETRRNTDKFTLESHLIGAADRAVCLSKKWVTVGNDMVSDAPDITMSKNRVHAKKR